MKEISLTKGYVALVDDEDYELVSRHKWHAFTRKTTSTVYAQTFVPKSGGGQSQVFMHRLIMGADRGMEVDHRNGDGLLNTRANLRLCSHGENTKNRRKRASASSVFKGVAWDKQRRKWRTLITHNGKQFFLGLHTDPIEAARAYDRKAIELHGEFAALNFPNG